MNVTEFKRSIVADCAKKIMIIFPDIDLSSVRSSIFESMTYQTVLNLLSRYDGEINEYDRRKIQETYFPSIIEEAKKEIEKWLENGSESLFSLVKMDIGHSLMKKYSEHPLDDLDNWISQTEAFSKLKSFVKKGEWKSYSFLKMLKELEERFAADIIQEVSEMIEKNERV